MTGKTTAVRLTQHLDTNGKEYYEQLKKRRIWTDAQGNRFATVDEIEYKRLVEQAEQARELEGKYEFTDMNSILNSLKECDEENKRLRAAIKQALEKCKWNNEESARILEQALEGEQ